MSDGDLADRLKFLIEEFERSSLRVVHLRRGDIEIHLSRDAQQPSADFRQPGNVPASSEAAPPKVESQGSSGEGVVQASDLPDGHTVLKAPNIGTFYRSPKPGAPPYVELGQKVAIGDELCLIEVMKLFTAVRSEVAGTITAILVDDGTMVEAGQALFAIDED